MNAVDAVILAAGRLPSSDARGAGVELKALARIGDTTPLDTVILALRSSRSVRRVILVGPAELRASGRNVDAWVDERPTGEENVLAGLAAARTPRAIVSASDVPFVRASHVDDFLERTPADADFAYPVFERGEFLSAFPGGRSRFARVGDEYFTGGSLCLMNVELALRNAALIRHGFTARKSQVAMASLLGLGVLLRYATGTLNIRHIEHRLSQLTGGRAVAVRGANPALAMDCDTAPDIEYARNRLPESQLQ